MLAIEVVIAMTIGAVVVCVHILISAPALPRSKSECTDLFRRMYRWACGGSGEGQPGDRPNRLESLLVSWLADIRAQYLGGILQMWMHLITLVALSMLLRFAMGVPVRNSLANMSILAFIYIIGLAVRWFPAILNQHTLWVFHSLCMASVVMTNVYLHAEARQLSRRPILLARVSVGLAYPVALPNLLWNSAFTGVGLVDLLTVDSAYSASPLSNVLATEITELVFLSILLRWVDTLQTSQVRSDLQATGYMRTRAAMGSILSDMCDAVVQLGPQLDIRQACPKLAGLLLREPSSAAMQGESFPDVILNDTDRQSFLNFVESRSAPMEDRMSRDHDERVPSIYIRLRAAQGISVNVQVFHSCHHGPLEDICHIVGVREVERESVADDAPNDDAVPLPRPERASDDVEIEVASSSGSVRTGTSVVLAPLIPEHNQLAPVSLLLDPMAMEIVAGTVGLRTLLGPILFKVKVRDFVANYNDFDRWLQDMVNRFLFDQELLRFEARVVPPLMRNQADYEFHADAFIIQMQEDVRLSEMGVEQPVGEHDEQHRMLCLVELKDAKLRCRQSRREKATVEPWPRSGILSL